MQKYLRMSFFLCNFARIFPEYRDTGIPGYRKKQNYNKYILQWKKTTKSFKMITSFL